MNRLDLTLRSTIHIQYANALGIFTKSQSTPENKGFQRVHDFLLQDQSELNRSNRRGEGGSVTCNTPSSLVWALAVY